MDVSAEDHLVRGFNPWAANLPALAGVTAIRTAAVYGKAVSERSR